MILLDTNAVIAVLNDTPTLIGDKIVDRLDAGEIVGVSSIVVSELRYGIAKSRRKAANADRLGCFLAGSVGVLPFDEDDAMSAGALRAVLSAAGTPIGPYDVLIAGQALRHGATLITTNIREFERVPGLIVEDWAKP